MSKSTFEVNDAISQLLLANKDENSGSDTYFFYKYVHWSWYNQVNHDLDITDDYGRDITPKERSYFTKAVEDVFVKGVYDKPKPVWNNFNKQGLKVYCVTIIDDTIDPDNLIAKYSRQEINNLFVHTDITGGPKDRIISISDHLPHGYGLLCDEEIYCRFSNKQGYVDPWEIRIYMLMLPEETTAFRLSVSDPATCKIEDMPSLSD